MIELIVVIVILGILAATALPKFIDLRGDAQLASLQGMAGTASSAMSVNYAGCSATNNSIVTGKCVKVSNCTDLGGVLQGGLPNTFTVTAAAATTNGTPVTCTINLNGYTPASPVTFTAIGAAN